MLLKTAKEHIIMEHSPRPSYTTRWSTGCGTWRCHSGALRCYGTLTVLDLPEPMNGTAHVQHTS